MAISDNNTGLPYVGHPDTVTEEMNAWPECSLRALEMVLESGDLDWLEKMLNGERVARVLALRIPEVERRVQDVQNKLIDARVLEAAAGGPGSLINHAHPSILFRRSSEKIRAKVVANRQPHSAGSV